MNTYQLLIKYKEYNIVYYKMDKDIVQGVSYFKYETRPIETNEIYTILYMLKQLNRKRKITQD